eukprot:CAMPEP_0117451360 /NCGR_PEP_ID=MMETSP0759-20121206/8965_1 /TAXON_ID=63605 /ORGANISM="Percolomonas cosmopolitus, Strain WS" /LENGTH=311 /DNA_ID=CAMNT_0005243953 /DNA_START=278 /DNA_END=1213 /DNA_ORIENTATION=+
MPSSNPFDFITATRIGRIALTLTKYFMKIFGAALIGTALFLMTAVGYVYFFVMLDLLSMKSILLKALLFGMGLFFGFNVFFNYIQCIRTDPGSVPAAWLQSMDEQDVDCLARDNITIKGKKWSKYCNKCQKPKPPRAHHCHICDRCVMRMDHHCPWLSSCVGYNNHRYFVLFLIYLCICCCLLSTFLGSAAMGYWSVDSDLWYEYHSWLSFIMVLCGSLGVTLCGFTAWHIYLVLTNQTTIEFQFNKLRQFTESRRDSTVPINEYNVGIWNNLQQIFGRTTAFWFFMPTLQNPPLNGFEWPTVESMSKGKV